jgi:hypothetical protein
MPRPTRSTLLLRKAEAALLAALEHYNKPTVVYREETFVILMLNAWELLLKAHLVAASGNTLNSIYSYQAIPTKAGTPSKRSRLERSRSGTPKTIGFWKAFERVRTTSASVALEAVRANLEAVWEIRNACSHFVTTSADLRRQVLEIGTACVSNFVEIARSWFLLSIQRQHLYLLPIGFLTPPEHLITAVPGADERKLLAYLTELQENAPVDPAGIYSFSVDIGVTITRKSVGSAAPVEVILTADPSAAKITMTDEDIRTRYPWDYKQLRERLKARYSDFKQDDQYHRLRRQIDADVRFAKIRFLDPGNPKSGKKKFYNPNILTAFDKHYTRVE